MQRLAEISADRYAAAYSLNDETIVDQEFDHWKLMSMDFSLPRAVESPVWIEPRALRVTLPKMLSGKQFEERKSLKERKPEGTLADWAEAHPPEAEALAIQTALYLAKIANAHLYVVHVSSRDGLNMVRRARREGARVTAETMTPYLSLDSSDENGFLVKMVPPIRAKEHGDALWGGLTEGTINTLGTDNTSRTRGTKQPGAGLHGARPGYPVLGTHLPSMLHYGRLRGVPLEMLIDATTRAPAKVYGIYPRKGTISIGSDADLVVVDPDLERVVRAEDLNGMSDFSPFEGKTLRGWPIATIKAGEIIARDGRIVATANGRYLPRKPAGHAPVVPWLSGASIRIMNNIPSKAQTGPSLVPVAENVYAWIGVNGDSNAGVVTTPQGLIVIDAQQTEAQGRNFRKTIETALGKPVIRLVNSHFHLDHVAATSLSPMCPFWHTKRTGQILREMLGKEPPEAGRSATPSPS
ncbi:MAG: amidohydrolase family protein [Methylovirgula sp.]